MSDRPTHFPHRQDSDGLCHSICPTCFATVARSRPEAEVAELEMAHVCNPRYLQGPGRSNSADTTLP
jgi:hypothetical protein